MEGRVGAGQQPQQGRADFAHEQTHQHVGALMPHLALAALYQVARAVHDDAGEGAHANHNQDD